MNVNTPFNIYILKTQKGLKYLYSCCIQYSFVSVSGPVSCHILRRTKHEEKLVSPL